MLNWAYQPDTTDSGEITWSMLRFYKMSLLQPHPDFLPALGKHVISWNQEHQMFQNYLLKLVADAHPAALHKTLFQHFLGVEGQWIPYALLAKENSPASAKAEASIAEKCNSTRECSTLTMPPALMFQQNGTSLDSAPRLKEYVDTFVTVIHELSASWKFVLQADDFIQDQLVAKTNARYRSDFSLILGHGRLLHEIHCVSR